MVKVSRAIHKSKHNFAAPKIIDILQLTTHCNNDNNYGIACIQAAFIISQTQKNAANNVSAYHKYVIFL